MTMKREALDALDRGWSIFPARDKRPLISWKPYQERLPTRAEVEKWWDTYPDAQIAVATGMISGLIVLDLDGPSGIASIDGLDMPDTIIARTGNGLHYYFRHPGLDTGQKIRNFARRLPGVDLRGDGGYVIAPPSVHSEGRSYTWEADPEEGLEPPPGWLLELLIDPEKGPAAPNPYAGDDGVPWHERLMALGVDEGSRNDALARLAGYLLRLNSEETVLYMIEAWNATKVRPPLPSEEVEQTVRSIAKAERRRREGLDKPQEIEAEEVTASDDPEEAGRQHSREFISGMLELSVERVVKYLREPPVYKIQIEGQTVNLGSVESLIDYRPFRRAIADGLQRLINIPKDRWAEVAAALLNSVEPVEVHTGTDADVFLANLSAYLEDHAPAAGEDADSPEYWQAAAWENLPIIRDGRVYVSLSHLRKWISGAADEKFSIKDLSYTARTLGLDTKVFGLWLRGRKTSRSYWSLPGEVAAAVGVEVPA